MDFDSAQICKNGHVVNFAFGIRQHSNQEFCSKCGAATITQCQHCSTSIKGAEVLTTLQSVLGNQELFPRPNYCIKCGKPFPWTAQSIQAAHDLLFETASEQDARVF